VSLSLRFSDAAEERKDLEMNAKKSATEFLAALTQAREAAFAVDTTQLAVQFVAARLACDRLSAAGRERIERVLDQFLVVEKRQLMPSVLRGIAGLLALIQHCEQTNDGDPWRSIAEVQRDLIIPGIAEAIASDDVRWIEESEAGIRIRILPDVHAN